MLKCGCFLGFDRIYTQCEEQAKTLFELISNGWEDKILLSHDYYVFIDSKDYDWNKQKELISNSERSYTTISKVLLPMLENMGISKVQIKKLMHDNPLSLLNSD